MNYGGLIDYVFDAGNKYRVQIEQGVRSVVADPECWEVAMGDHHQPLNRLFDQNFIDPPLPDQAPVELSAKVAEIPANTKP
jgi:hypothetical protein